MTFMRALQGRVNADGLPLYVVTFELTVPIAQNHHWRAMLISWVPAEEKAHPAQARRRAARSVVGLGLQTADAISSLMLMPSVKSLPAPATSFEISYTAEIRPGNLSRVARVEAHMNEAPKRSKLDPNIPTNASTVLRRLARELHGSIGMPANIEVFGK